MTMVYTTPTVYTPCHYTTNRAILNDPSVNVTFDRILRMDDAAWQDWLTRLRVAILTQWNTHNVPPRVGMTDREIMDAWNRLASSRLDDVWVTCDDGVEGISVSPTSHSVVNQWFPGLMRTRITYNSKDKGISIYDMFADDTLWQRYCRSYAVRHFRRDSFYAYSRAIHTHEPIPTTKIVPTSVVDYLNGVLAATQSVSAFDDVGLTSYGVWFSPAMADEDYNGYSDNLKGRSIWTVSPAEAVRLRDSGRYPAHWFRAVSDQTKKAQYMVRLYETTKRVLPDGYKSFRISMCQYAVNFPVLAARALYERYTSTPHPIVFDPSAGWGGRLVGAITAARHGTYIACDPNSDHLWTDAQGTTHSKYTELAAFHASIRPFGETPNVVFFPVGSETMRDQPEFQPYKGRVDVAGTSCPYFSKEQYSDDPEQSCHKFPEFDGWCEGFLKPTIETAAEWLKPGGVLFWNIADVKIGGKFLPLEAKSVEYALAAGLVQEDTVRLLLTNMPGGNRVNEDGTGMARNTCFVGGKLQKFEPVYIFRKP